MFSPKCMDAAATVRFYAPNKIRVSSHNLLIQLPVVDVNAFWLSSRLLLDSINKKVSHVSSSWMKLLVGALFNETVSNFSWCLCQNQVTHQVASLPLYLEPSSDFFLRLSSSVALLTIVLKLSHTQNVIQIFCTQKTFLFGPSLHECLLLNTNDNKLIESCCRAKQPSIVQVEVCRESSLNSALIQ